MFALTGQIFAICIVFALGLDQSPHSGRWRLLLMSENEEMAWSRRKCVIAWERSVSLRPDIRMY